MTYEEDEQKVSFWDFIAQKYQSEYTCVKCKKKFNRVSIDKGRTCPRCSNKESK